MENVVSARRLRKSYLNSGEKETKAFFSANEILKDINLTTSTKLKENTYDFDNEDKKEENNNTFKLFKISFKTKFLFKVFIASVILFSVFLIKIVFYSSVKDNSFIKFFVSNYNKEYSKGAILEKTEEFSKKIYSNLNYAIPAKIAEGISKLYVNNIKPKVIEKDLKEVVYSVFNNKNINNSVNIYNATDENGKEKDIDSKNVENHNNSVDKVTQETPKDSSITDGKSENIVDSQKEEVIGMGGGNPNPNQKVEEEANTKIGSAVSLMQMDAEEIKSKKIEWITPTHGTITSRYGAREQIFDDVNPFHTGIDIANKLGTNINSATDGTVVRLEENNKYYGKMVDVEMNGVVFRYAHLDSINVKLKSTVKKNDLIGHMGSTGYSTGPHLHFEVRINGRSVNPELVGFYK